MGKQKSASAPPGSNWLSLQKALPSKGKTAAKRKRLGSALASPTSSTLPTGEDSAPVYSTRASTSRSAIRVVAEDGIDAASNEVKQLRKLILGVGTATEELVGEPGRYLALDCEMVGVGEDAKESSLARASIVDYHGRVVLDEYVQQRERVTDYRTQWSGIRPEDMIHAKPFREVQDRVAELLAPADRILVGHALHNDLSALLLSHPASRTRDTQVYAGKKPAPRPIKSRSKGKQSADTLDADTLAPTLWEKYRTPHVGLKKLVKGELDVDIQQGEHSSVTDARAAMAIYRLHKRAWDASLPISHMRTQPAKHVLDEGVDSEESGTESLGRPKRKRRKSAISESAPGGGRRGVSSGLSTIVRSGAHKKGMNTRDTKIFAATKGKGSHVAKDKWWQSLGDAGGASGSKGQLPMPTHVSGSARKPRTATNGCKREVPRALPADSPLSDTSARVLAIHTAQTRNSPAPSSSTASGQTAGEMDNASAIESQPILVEPFVPPPRAPRRVPTGPRVIIRSPTAQQRQNSYSESSRSALVQSPQPYTDVSLRSQSSQETLATESGRSVSFKVPDSEYLSPSKRKPGVLNPSMEGYHGHMDGLTTTSSNDSSPLLTPPTPKRQQSIATQLPTVPIPPSPSDRPWKFVENSFLSKFEPVPAKELVIHTALCFAAFPFVYLLCMAGSGLSLFWSRAIVGAVCGIVGLALGYNIIKLSQRGIESALWATVIHESMRPDGGVTLEQLNDYVAHRGSPWAAIRLLFSRMFHHKGAQRTHRRKYDQTPWTLFILLFLFAVMVSTCLVFMFGRIVDIYTKQERQWGKYYETTIMGDLSNEDITRAKILADQAYSNFNITWSLTPFSSAGLIPMGRSFAENRLKLNPQATKNVTDTVWFAETYPDQLAPNGLGFGTFDDEDSASSSNSGSPVTESKGQILRWQRWGIRVGCTTLDNLDKYLIPVSPINNMTYLFVPKTTMYSLFESMDIPYPAIKPANFTALMIGEDKPPANISEADIAVTGKWWQNGVAHSFMSIPATKGDDGNGWLQIEIVLVRLNQAYAPNSSFSVHSLADVDYPSPIGYDVAVCVEEFKPYVLDAYNNTAGSPTTLRLLHRGLDFDQLINTPQNTTMQDGVQRGIDSKGKFVAFASAHDNSRNVMIKDNGRDFRYVPNPTLVSFTNGSGPLGYTKLDPMRVANALAKSDSQHLLPYLAGSQPIVARSYPDKTVAYIKISQLWLAILLLIMLLLGYIVAIFVPRLPLGLPRRDFGVFSWLAAIEGDAIVGLPTGVGRYEHLEELKRRGRHVKVRYNAPSEHDWNLSESDRAHKEFFERQFMVR
ncbi:exonuclease domain protein [Ceratobasidium sp. AG-Ba]|nr:exonuclease domain protein [Ceratobasidium sp. AG-Ba]